MTDAEIADLSYEEITLIRNNETRDRVGDIVEKLMKELNGMGNMKVVGEAFVDAVQRNHRTLQQSFFGEVLVRVIKDFAKRYDEGRFDLRNEDSCKCAKKLEPVLKDMYFRFI